MRPRGFCVSSRWDLAFATKAIAVVSSGRSKKTAAFAWSRNAHLIPAKSTLRGLSDEPLEARNSQRQLARSNLGAFRSGRLEDHHKLTNLPPPHPSSGT